MVSGLHRCRVVPRPAIIPRNERIQSDHSNSRDARVCRMPLLAHDQSSFHCNRRLPPSYMLDMGKQTGQFFDSYVDHYGQKKYRLKSIEQYSREHSTNEQPGKQYFKATSLPEIVNTAPMPTFKSSSRQGHEMEKGPSSWMLFLRH